MQARASAMDELTQSGTLPEIGGRRCAGSSTGPNFQPVGRRQRAGDSEGSQAASRAGNPDRHNKGATSATHGLV